MLNEPEKIIPAHDDRRLALLGQRLLNWLVTDLNQPAAGSGPAPAFTNSRAKALMWAAELLDEPTWNDFSRLVQAPAGGRIALYELLSDSGLLRNEELLGLAQVSASTPLPEGEVAVDWLPLILAAFAWQRQFPLYQLDPASPPGAHSPAGQILKRGAHFIRQQVQRSATDREKLARKLAFDPSLGGSAGQGVAPEAPIAPLPPHYRMPVPIRYPEYSRETVQVSSEELNESPATPARGAPIVITEDDLAERPSTPPATMPEIRISRDQVEPELQHPPSPLPPSAVIMPTPARSSASRSGLTISLRNAFRSEDLKSTKLRVVVQDYPDGPGLYGLQVKVTCQGIKSFVAGTTNREGNFVAELPVRLTEGLTYDVDVTWPRELGGEVERKSITLNADRTEFRLPFYRSLQPDGE